jgi:hypothetical protein
MLPVPPAPPPRSICTVNFSILSALKRLKAIAIFEPVGAGRRS